MKINKNLVFYTFWILLTIAGIVSAGFVAVKKNLVSINSIEISIDRSKDYFFIEESDIKDLLNQKHAQIQGFPIGDINTAMLEKWVRSNPFVANAEVYSNIDGKFHIDVTQRNPILRIIGGKDSYYMDEQGTFMPLSDKYTARVLVANGFIFEPYTYGEAKALLDENDEPDSLQEGNVPPYNFTLKDTLFTLASFVEKDPFWKAQIQQVYVNEKHEFELIPLAGNHRIIFGSLEDMQEKFSRLLKFYKEGLKKTGWDKYETINLKYKNQIVCTKVNHI